MRTWSFFPSSGFFMKYPYESQWYSFGLWRLRVGGTVEPAWGSCWSADWSRRLEMLSSGGVEVARRWSVAGWMELNWDNQSLYCKSPDLFFAALAECEFNVAAVTSNPSQKSQLLRDAKAHMAEAISLMRDWHASELAQKIDQTIRSFSEIRKNARLLYQGARSPINPTVLSILPDEHLTRIAGFTGDPLIHDEKKSGEIAWQYFTRPQVRLTPKEQQVPPGCCAPVAQCSTALKNG
jgi:hypothetical protein